MKRLYILILLCTGISLNNILADNSKNGKVSHTEPQITKVSDRVSVTMQLILDSLTLRSNHQLYVTPVIDGYNQGSQVRKVLPSVVLSGRNMHYVYLRTGKTVKSDHIKYTVGKEVYHKRGTKDTLSYAETLPYESWMMSDDSEIFVYVDTCGCGLPGRTVKPAGKPLGLNPLNRMTQMPYPVPSPVKDKEIKHEGRAQVQFEVDKWEVHNEVYPYTHRITKRRHVIDNRAQLQIFDDSLKYALSSPNVELTGLRIVGYASPESPYDHNEFLAKNRAESVLKYIEKNYNIPDSICSYDAVPENWEGFRQQVMASTQISEEDRSNLIALIDRPVHSPMDYDRKEKELETSPKFAHLYKTAIHPDWFPELRYTHFTITTRLKTKTLDELRQVIKTEPHLLSLNQIYLVATSYPRDSEEYRQTMEVAVREFPNDTTANLNAAAFAIDRKEYAEAEKYIAKAGNGKEAQVIRGILELYKGNEEEACKIFEQVDCIEAKNNLKHLR